MILLYLGLFFGFIWWIANANLKENFNPYLKYSALFFIAIFIATDIYLFIETDRFYIAKSIGGDNGITYSYWNDEMNTTTETTLFGRQDEDSGTIMAYHWAEYEVMPLLIMMLPYVALFVAAMFGLQYLYLWWRTTYYDGSGAKGKDKDREF